MSLGGHLKQRNEIVSTTTLLEGWSRVVRVVYRQLRRDGTWQKQDRDLLDRGHGVTILLYNRQKKSVLLLKQPRIIATLSGIDGGETIEACNGLVEGEEPLVCAYREAEEETGHRPTQLTQVNVVYASPGASLELVYLFIGEYDNSTAVTQGGGILHEGEDIEVLEVSLCQALRWRDEPVIRDARTMLLLDWAERHLPV
jgi:GDP-mannose pyrophosphatase NudK